MRNWDRLVGRVEGACQRRFGQMVRYLPVVSAPGVDLPDIGCVFDKAHAEKKVVNGVLVSTAFPLLEVAGNDLPAPPLQGDRAVIDGVTYTVMDVRSDGAGNYLLPLQLGIKTRL